jgi:hypothetical protein
MIENGYIIAIGIGFDDVEISKKEYDEILAIIRNKPIADTGYVYRLKEDLTWELVEIHITEPTEDEGGDV